MSPRSATTKLRQSIVSIGAALLLASCWTQPVIEPEVDAGKLSEVQPRDAGAFPDKNLWGDVHLHTNQSFDSYAYGLTSITPDDAYRFARGDEVTTQSGIKANLKKPLDFLMVADHSEFLGVMAATQAKDPMLSDYPIGKRWLEYARNGDFGAIFGELAGVNMGHGQAEEPSKIYRAASWEQVVDVAERYYAPGKFTTFAGYEWTATMNGAVLHRVVMYADGPDKTRDILPFTSLDSNNPEDLWRALAAYQRQTGGAALSIPHNGNQSRGLMFAATTELGDPITRDYALLRRRFEPVLEMTQVKGDGETHPALSMRDEFADFENWSVADVDARQASEDEPREDLETLRGSYARGALLRGLSIRSEIGVNPYEFGMIGSTDMHTGVSAASEDNFFGKFADSEPSPTRLSGKLGDNWWAHVNLSASGYIAVWAEENTRKAIFAAIKRREVYASSGPRIRLRFFGGSGLPNVMPKSSELAKVGYAHGVPMGGVLPQTNDSEAPRFLVSALMDPDEARLDRIQIVKGWLNAAGELQERVFDVAVSDGRRIDPVTHRAAPLRDTVDPRTATYERSLGAAELDAAWTDPEFDPSQDAFYYVRVLQVATPRWSTYDAVRYGLPLPKARPVSIQDRVYSSPIWVQAR